MGAFGGVLAVRYQERYPLAEEFQLLTFCLSSQASTQTDALKLPPSQPPRLLKNKALLCKPITQTKATSCKPHTQHKECQTGTLAVVTQKNGVVEHDKNGPGCVFYD